MIGLVGVDYAVGGAAAGPDEEEDVFAGWGGVDFGDEFVGAGDGVTVDFEDDVAGSEACIFRGALRANALNCRTVDVGGDVELLPHFGREIADGDA